MDSAAKSPPTLPECLPSSSNNLNIRVAQPASPVDPLVPSEPSATTQTATQWSLRSDSPAETPLFQNMDPDLDAHSPRREPRWFDKTRYTRIVDGNVIRYVHRTAGRVLRKSTTRWGDLVTSREKAHPGAPWYPFPNEAQWKLGHWLSTCKSSQSKIDEFLSMDDVSAYLASCYMLTTIN